MVRIGLVGIGFMGWIHYLAYRKHASAKLAAVASRDSKKRGGDWRGIQGNFGPPGEVVDLSQVAQYATLEELLADSSIDAVDLCLPPHVHADATIAALEAGKHVFVEKPMALTTDECDRMMAAAKAAGRQVLVGHVLPFLPEYQLIRAAIADGRWGKIQGGHFRRVISDPKWLADFYDLKKVGGPLIDLHVHDAHFIRMVFGMPKTVTTVGRSKSGTVSYCQSVFGFSDPDLVVSAASGVVMQQGRPFTHAYEIHFERATVFFEFAALAGDVPAIVTPVTVLTEAGGVERPAMPAGDPMIAAFESEIDEVVRSIREGKPSPILSGELARDALVLCSKQAESAQQRQTVSV